MTATEARPPKRSRKFLWLTIFIVLLFGGYSAGWFYLADRVKAEVVKTIDRMNRGDVSVECVNPQVGGFPFRIGVSCDRVGYEDGTRHVQASANAFRSLAQVYQPMRAIAELDGPLRATAPGIGTIRLDWQRLRASVRIARPVPERISIEAENLKGERHATDAQPQALFSVAKTAGHLRPNGADVDWAGTFTGLQVDPAAIDGRTLPLLDGSGQATLKDGVALVLSRPQSLRGQEIEVAGLELMSGEAQMSLHGSISVGSDGLVDADLTLAVRNPGAVAEVLATTIPEQARPIRQGFAGLALLGTEPSIPLKIVRGKVNLGPIKLGDIPPLK